MKASDLDFVNELVNRIRTLHKYKNTLEDVSIENPIQIYCIPKILNTKYQPKDITDILDKVWVSDLANNLLDHINDMIYGYKKILEEHGVDMSDFNPE